MWRASARSASASKASSFRCHRSGDLLRHDQGGVQVGTTAFRCAYNIYLWLLVPTVPPPPPPRQGAIGYAIVMSKNTITILYNSHSICVRQWQ